jgi:hypothetical protein
VLLFLSIKCHLRSGLVWVIFMIKEPITLPIKTLELETNSKYDDLGGFNMVVVKVSY